MTIGRSSVIQGYFPQGRPRIPAPPAATPPRAVSPLPVHPAFPPAQPAAPHARPPAVHVQRAVQPSMAPPRPAVPVPQPTANATAFPLPPNLLVPNPGGGQRLPPAVQQKMETFFKTSFADVRVHVGHQAASIGAIAFTHGTNLYFAPGHYNPQTPQGQELLGHELAHVVQQRAGQVRNPFGSGVAVVQDRVLEMEANRMGQLAARQQTVQPQMRTAPAPQPFVVQMNRRRQRRQEREAELIRALDEDAGEEPERMVKPGSRRQARRRHRRAERRGFELEARRTSMPYVDRTAREDAPALEPILEAIERQYPPRQWVYVGIGASPEILLELLRRRGGRTTSITVSGVKNAPITNPAEMRHAIRDVLYQLGVYATQNVNLLLLDATDTNATLTTLQRVIAEADRRNQVRRKVKTASITQTKTLRAGQRETVPGSDIDVLEVDDHPARQLMRSRFFYQWYKTNLGRSTGKRDFSEVIAGNDPPVEVDVRSRRAVIRFGATVRATLTPDVFDFDTL